MIEDIINECLNEHSNWPNGGRAPSENVGQLLNCIIIKAANQGIPVPDDIFNRMKTGISKEGLTLRNNGSIDDFKFPQK